MVCSLFWRFSAKIGYFLVCGEDWTPAEGVTVLGPKKARVSLLDTSRDGAGRNVDRSGRSSKSKSTPLLARASTSSSDTEVSSGSESVTAVSRRQKRRTGRESEKHKPTDCKTPEQDARATSRESSASSSSLLEEEGCYDDEDDDDAEKKSDLADDSEDKSKKSDKKDDDDAEDKSDLADDARQNNRVATGAGSPPNLWSKYAQDGDDETKGWKDATNKIHYGAEQANKWYL
eukprot:CAMPEP_0179009760 /NCGR_PEP_ID=MMETSP0795-20121207/16441_1 /TAXON_ID=88552 /ORGANISM="Amoebophrya sp., Strain Ameob2" /LENGTH=231 /DNA_ID=CAMNT_0020704973 /DNA_START=1055 /DNA_END=1751 /DNA_ORIENTATION=-